MAFLPGNTGRPKGALNKRSREFVAILEKHDFCPVTALIEVHREARHIYDNYAVIYRAIWEAKTQREGEMSAPPEDKAHVYLKIAGDSAKELIGYTYPKLKSIEQAKPAPLDEMTAQEKLSAMKQAVAFLEMQVKAEGKA